MDGKEGKVTHMSMVAGGTGLTPCYAVSPPPPPPSSSHHQQQIFTNPALTLQAFLHHLVSGTTTSEFWKGPWHKQFHSIVFFGLCL